ncbi:CGNR zinc finger domain-containing protein [Streptomyces chitinivorans]|uniref:CGNR zinc finger domain-containing protein n=1 Tax=Streptomyces chitinivorans TaxID=1257027 RepID=A0ABW7HM36_9ACTN|nr:CGNR zinc finger domain-containing protein [Streptomyces chitinivorans]MDH2412338.1 CGNR zinc finger domain-containing protein [Streptomyces chitinivorans]
MTGQARIRQPGDRETAPGRLALVQAFVNSVNVEFGPDAFATTGGLARWMERFGPAAGESGVTEAGRARAVELREALRALARENNAGTPDPVARATVERIAADCPLVLAFEESGLPGLRPGRDGVEGLIGQILGIVVEAAREGTWTRLKACHDHRCEWVFYDRARNRSGRWCSMAVCGTRSKMHTYRRGLKAAAGR